MRRVAAYVADCVILFAGLLMLQAVLYPINPILTMQRGGAVSTPGRLHAWVFATATLPFLLYFAATIGSSRQSTLGMRWMGLRVEEVGGVRLSLARSLVRSIVLLLPFELNHTVMFHLTPASGAEPSAGLWMGIAAVWLALGTHVVVMFMTPRRQSVHDLVAGSVVVLGTRGSDGHSAP